MATQRSIERNQGWRVVTIKEVNLKSNHIQAEDQYGTPMMIDVTAQNSFLQIPVVGEMWTVSRRGSDWILERKYQNPDTSLPITQMKPGDARIEASGTIWMIGDIQVQGNIAVSGTFPTTPFIHQPPPSQPKDVQTGTTRVFQGAARPFVNANPPSSPQRSDEWIYAGSTFYWDFMYDNLEITYKWKFVGGPPLSAEILTGEGFSDSATYTDPTTAGPSVTAPRTGEYEITFGFGAAIGASDAHIYCSPRLGVSSTSDNDAAMSATTANALGRYAYTSRTIVRTLNASDVVKLQYRRDGTAGGGPVVAYRYIQIRPIRVA